MNQTMEVRILEGASALFYKYGFNRVRFSEIAREVGITTRTIYNYFPNKHSLSKAVSVYTIKRIMAEMQSLADSDLNFSEMIIKMLKQLYRELRTRLPAYRKDSELSIKGFDSLIPIDPEIRNFIGTLIQRAISESIFDADAPVEIMMQILLNQINFCFPADGAHSADAVSEEYFISSMILIIQSCLTEKGRDQLAQIIQKA